MENKTETKWREKYLRLRDYVAVHHQLPDKRKAENRELYNWWKYNLRQFRQGKLSDRNMQLLKKLNGMRAERKIEL